MTVSTNQDNFNIENLNDSFQSDVEAIVMAYETGWSERGIDDKRQLELRLKTNLNNTFNYIKEVISHFKKLDLPLDAPIL